HPELKDELARLVELARAERPGSEAALEFAVRFGQTCDPVMAEGVEDTAYYRWHRMDALNEVGGDPLLLDHAAPEMLHEWAAEQQRSRPLSMTGLSTHDSKRSEDVRARLIALAGDAESWVRCAEAFTAAAAGHDVHPADAQLVWQTLAGAGDIGEERLTGYLLKALREAKERTAHVDGDPRYETRVLALAAEATAPGRLKALVDTALEHNAEAIRATVLGQKLLALTLPGVADSYQGTEVVNLRLVDPDNRWTADFATMRNRLEGLAVRGPRDLDDEKLLLTSRTLALRRELRDSFGEHSDYLPVVADTRHVVGFVRGEVAVLVTRALQRLQAAGGWGNLGLELPEGLWRDEITEHLHGGGENRCADVFEDYPVALLRRVHRS
ncbi:MAG: malto-oligosyltrehalose synthase, partial [Nocardioidaceae bacterium]